MAFLHNPDTKLQLVVMDARGRIDLLNIMSLGDIVTGCSDVAMTRDRCYVLPDKVQHRIVLLSPLGEVVRALSYI